MRTKRYIIIVLAVLLGFNLSVMAQDSRNRVTSTIIADGLAQLPAKNLNVCQQVMSEMAGTGSEGMQMLISYLAPSAQAKNAKFEYAIDGIVNYVSAHDKENLRPAIREALKAGIDSQTDPVNKAFLMSQLQKIATAADAPLFEKYLGDKNLGEPAAVAIATIGDAAVVKGLIEKGMAPKATLAKLVEQVPVDGVENILAGWTNGADVKTLKAIYNGLAACGTESSYKLLHDAAKAVGFNDDPTGATDAYLKYLHSNVGDLKLLGKAAKELMKSSNGTVRNAGLEIMGKSLGYADGSGNDYLLLPSTKLVKALLPALKDSDRQYRNTALRMLWGSTWNDTQKSAVAASVAKAFPGLSDDAKIDVVRWLGNIHATDQIGIVTKQLTSGNSELADAAITAAGQIGGDKALSALLGLLGGDKAAQAAKALLAFNGNINNGVVDALASDDANVQNAALKLAADRHIYEAYPGVMALLAPNGQPNPVAYEALKGVVKAENFGSMCDLLDAAQPSLVPALQAAAKAALRNQNADDQYKTIAERLSRSGNKAVYYPLLAQAGTKAAIDYLGEAYKGGNASALDALLTVNNDQALPLLFNIAQNNASVKDKVLGRYLTLAKAARKNRDEKLDLYSQALELNPSANIAAQFVSALAGINNQPALTLASKYMANEGTAEAAATTVKTIIAKNESLQGCEGIKDMLVKAQGIFAAKKDKGDADAGYAVDEIKGLLEKVEAQEKLSVSVNALTPEEKKQGFELLFDGKSLDKWFGNKTNYVPDNGTIYVSAGYGAGGNLYTNKKYSDFVYRFEFCFLEEGVNNGVGIRTSEGVDAAYEGMEIQILDHDAPIYAGLRDYQQHGSVYGIIVPKRVNFGPVGKWHSEEIRAVGDQITVTVDGEVILDGNIREACQGHNVAPDGGTHNPYTVDHNNHPGLFNKEGNISFCGHGEGVRFRNIRILDLSKQAKQPKQKGKKK